MKTVRYRSRVTLLGGGGGGSTAGGDEEEENNEGSRYHTHACTHTVCFTKTNCLNHIQESTRQLQTGAFLANPQTGEEITSEYPRRSR